MLSIYHTTNDVTFLRKLDFDLKWLEGFIRYFFNHISGNHWYTSQHLQKLEMSAHPGMLGLKSISLPLIILLSETPIMLNSKFNSSNRWTWKFSRFRLRLLILLCKKREAWITDTTGKFTFKFVETIWGIVSTMNTMIIETITRIGVFKVTGRLHQILFQSYFRESLIYKPTPPEARDVGTSRYAWIKIHFFTADYFTFWDSYNAKFEI